MSADRELLELAAKAEGHGVEFHEASGLSFWGDKFTGLLWNPLHNDSDALRLAVTCGLVVDCSRPSAGEPFKMNHFAQEDFKDRGAATRRAIVRAAAAIAKAAPVSVSSDKSVQQDEQKDSP